MTCGLCLMQPRVSGKAGPVMAVTPLRAAVSATCTNAAAGDACLVREDGCAVLRGQRCRLLETLLALVGERGRAAYARLHPETVRFDGPPVRTCPDCGAPLPSGRRVCNGCRDRRRRAAYREQRGRRATVDLLVGAQNRAPGPLGASTGRADLPSEGSGYQGSRNAETGL